MDKRKAEEVRLYREGVPAKISEVISDLGSNDALARIEAHGLLFTLGKELARTAEQSWKEDPEFSALLLHDIAQEEGQELNDPGPPKATVGVAVTPRNFERIRKATGSPRLASVPPDQDALEFASQVTTESGAPWRLDILTTKQPGGDGAIAKFLTRFGEGIQQVEYEVSDVDRATKILEERFGQKAIYPATRAGAEGTRVNFFLASTQGGKKILIELVEPAK